MAEEIKFSKHYFSFFQIHCVHIDMEQDTNKLYIIYMEVFFIIQIDMLFSCLCGMFWNMNTQFNAVK